MAGKGSHEPPVIIKKIKKAAHGGGHGGAWKIAYADFVTAMMAFFLLMWLLSSTNVGEKQGIADYFNRPLSALLKAGPGAAVTSVPKTEKKTEQEREKQKKADQAKLEALRVKLDTVIKRDPKLVAFKNQIKIEITKEGLRVQIVDDKNRPMFDVGLAILKDYTKVILHSVGATLNDVENPISITGHTDSLSYVGGEGGYSNWELSSDRANAARRELIIGGMQDKKVIEVRGLAAALPLFKNDLGNPGNRRISIVVLNQETVQKLLQEGAKPTAGGVAEPVGSPAPGDSPAPSPAAEASPAK